MDSTSRRRMCLGLALVFVGCSSPSKEPAASEKGDWALRFEPVALEDAPTHVTGLAFLPGGARFVLLTKGGRIHLYELREDAAVRLGAFDVPSVYDDLDCGLISFAVDPDFTRNRLFYVGQCLSRTESGIQRLTFSDDLASIPASAVEVIRAGDPAALRPWHNVGQIGFDAEGRMWALFGEKTVKENAQDLSNILGTLVRIRPRRGDGESGFDVVEDNPFVGRDGADPSIYAYGLRSPWTGMIDAKGRFWVGDVGSDRFEELDMISTPGANLGWPRFEGDCGEACDGTLPPVRVWDRSGEHPFLLDDPEATSARTRVAWVAPEYSPAGLDRYENKLSGRVIYGDMCVGYVRVLAVDDGGAVTEDRHVGHLAHTTGWAVGPDGYFYAATFERCTSDGAVPGPARLMRAVLDRR